MNATIRKIGPDVQGGWMREIDWVKVGPFEVSVLLPADIWLDVNIWNVHGVHTKENRLKVDASLWNGPQYVRGADHSSPAAAFRRRADRRATPALRQHRRRRTVQNTGRWGGPSVHAMLHFLFCHVSRESADEFYRLLDTGDNLTAASPIHRLRNLMVRAYSGQRTTRRTPTETMAVVIKTWNAWRAKEEVEHLHWRKSDRVPEIYGLPKAMQRATGRGIEAEVAV